MVARSFLNKISNVPVEKTTSIHCLKYNPFYKNVIPVSFAMVNQFSVQTEESVLISCNSLETPVNQYLGFHRVEYKYYHTFLNWSFQTKRSTEVLALTLMKDLI